ncbi:MAG: peroxiredoxin-like family protein [Bryobacteraceae bacterium]|jgi:peroxiredoxin
MPPGELQINVNQRRLLEETADRSRFVSAGDTLEPFSLPEVDGGIVALDDILLKGPAVLIFFRFAGCPTCNIALPYYQRQLIPELQELGATVVAISPQGPQRLAEIKRRYSFDFPVASDIGNALARKLGILYSYDQPSREIALSKGVDMGQVTGTGTWELPMPTVVVVDRDRTVRFADVSPDWLVRTEAETILDSVRKLVGAAVQ